MRSLLFPPETGFPKIQIICYDGTIIATLTVDMINPKVLDWIEGYILSRVLLFGDHVGTVKRSDFLLDLDTTSDYFRIYEGQRIQALSLPVKNRNLSMLLVEIEVCFQRGWDLMDSGEWTSEDYDRVYELSRMISAEINSIRHELEREITGSTRTWPADRAS